MAVRAWARVVRVLLYFRGVVMSVAGIFLHAACATTRAWLQVPIHSKLQTCRTGGVRGYRLVHLRKNSWLLWQLEREICRDMFSVEDSLGGWRCALFFYFCTTSFLVAQRVLLCFDISELEVSTPCNTTLREEGFQEFRFSQSGWGSELILTAGVGLHVHSIPLTPS